MDGVKGSICSDRAPLTIRAMGVVLFFKRTRTRGSFTKHRLKGPIDHADYCPQTDYTGEGVLHFYTIYLRVLYTPSVSSADRETGAFLSVHSFQRREQTPCRLPVFQYQRAVAIVWRNFSFTSSWRTLLLDDNDNTTF